MLRMLSVLAVFLTVAAAFALYKLKYDTRGLEIAVQAKERRLEKLEADIAVLKAERAYLARPERIEKLARKQGLDTIREDQYVEIDAAVPALEGLAQTGQIGRTAR